VGQGLVVRLSLVPGGRFDEIEPQTKIRPERTNRSGLIRLRRNDWLLGDFLQLSVDRLLETIQTAILELHAVDKDRWRSSNTRLHT